MRGARYHGQGSWAGECGSPGSLGKGELGSWSERAHNPIAANEMSGDAEIAAKQGREDERAPASSSESSGWVEPSLPESSLWIERRAAKSIRRGVVRASARERAHAAAIREAGTEDIESGRSWLLLLASFA